MTVKTEKCFFLSALIMDYDYKNKMNFSAINKVDLMWIYQAFKNNFKYYIYNKAVNYLCQQFSYYVTF